MKAWLSGRVAQIEVSCLPSYGPELNPNERLNANLKHVIGTKVPVRMKGKLQTTASENIQLIESDPERVYLYSQDPRVRDAA